MAKTTGTISKCHICELFSKIFILYSSVANTNCKHFMSNAEKVRIYLYFMLKADNLFDNLGIGFYRFSKMKFKMYAGNGECLLTLTILKDVTNVKKEGIIGKIGINTHKIIVEMENHVHAKKRLGALFT